MNDAAVNRPSAADQKPHRQWRWWQATMAYLALAAVAAGSIVLVDQGAMSDDIGIGATCKQATAQIRNPKSEIRNKFEIQNSNIKKN